MIREINELADTRRAAGVNGAESWALKETNASPLTRQLFEAPSDASTYKGRFQQVMACSDAVGRLSGNALSSVSSVIAEKVITLPGEITIGLLEMIAKHFIGNSAGLTRFFNTCKKANTEFFGVFAAPVTIATQIALRTSALALGVVAASLTVGAVAVKDLSAWSWTKIKNGCTLLAQKATQAWAAVKPKLIAIGKFLAAVAAAILVGIPLGALALASDIVKFGVFGLIKTACRFIDYYLLGGSKAVAKSQERIEIYSGLLSGGVKVDPGHRTTKFMRQATEAIKCLVTEPIKYNVQMKDNALKRAPGYNLLKRMEETSSMVAMYRNFKKAHQASIASRTSLDTARLYLAQTGVTLGDLFKSTTTLGRPTPQRTKGTRVLSTSRQERPLHSPLTSRSHGHSSVRISGVRELTSSESSESLALRSRSAASSTTGEFKSE